MRTNNNQSPGWAGTPQRGRMRVAMMLAIGVSAGALIGAGAVLTGLDPEPPVAVNTAPSSEPIIAAAVSDAEPAIGTETTPNTAPQSPAPAAYPATSDVLLPIVATQPRAGAQERIAAAATPASVEETVAPASVESPPVAARFGDEPLPGDETIGAETEPAIVTADAPAEPEPALPIDPDITVEVAETEAEVLAIEERLSAAGAAYFQLPPERDDPFEAALSGDVPLPQAEVNAWVNMRAGPDNDAEILVVVPAGATIGAEQGCPNWCEVSYEGQRGYIYQSFIRR